MFLPPCLEPCLSWTVRRFPRFSFSFSTFRLLRRSVGYTVPSVAIEKRGQLSSRPPNYPLITILDTLTLIHLFVFPSRSLRRPPAVAQLPPPVVNKNRSAKLQVEPWVPSSRALHFRILFFGLRPSGAMSGFLRRASLATVQLLRIIVQRGNWLRFPFNIHGD